MPARWIAWMGCAVALAGAAALVHAQAPAASIQLRFKADVSAEGVPTNIQPDAALPPLLQTMVRKRVAEWRYRVGIWQGRPVADSVSQQILADAVPAASGGFALRIKDVTYISVDLGADDMREQLARTPPPVYPPELVRRGVAGVLVYAYRVDAAGKAQDIELVYPQHPDRDAALLDAAGRAAIAGWSLPPTRVGGTPVDCRVLRPLVFALDTLQPKSPDLSAYRASHPELCPAGPVLVTKVAGTLL